MNSICSIALYPTKCSRSTQLETSYYLGQTIVRKESIWQNSLRFINRNSLNR
jgi:hypothetical protein